MRGIFTTVVQYAACYVIKAWVFHQSEYPWGNVPIYIVVWFVYELWGHQLQYLLVRDLSCYCMIHVSTVARVPHTLSSYKVYSETEYKHLHTCSPAQVLGD